MSVSDDELFNAPDRTGEGSSASFSQLFYENDRALEQYLKRLASLEPYGYEKESELWQELILLQEEFREKLSFFAITPKYLYGLVASCCQMEELDDIFPQSLIREHKEEDVFQWLEKIEKSIAEQSSFAV